MISIIASLKVAGRTPRYIFGFGLGVRLGYDMGLHWVSRGSVLRVGSCDGDVSVHVGVVVIGVLNVTW